MIDYINKDLFRGDSVDKQFVISFDGGTITNSELHENEFTLSESLCSNERLIFGSCNASEIRFKVSDIYGSLKNKWLTVNIILGGDADHPFRLGKFKVDSDKPDIDRNYRNVIGYDSMYAIINSEVISWYNELSFPMTLRNFRDSFFSHLGITQESTTLVNDNLIIEKTIDANTLSGKDVITSICEINGCFGHITRDGNFRYVILEHIATEGIFPKNDLYPKDDLYPLPMNSEVLDSSVRINCGYEDYIVGGITRVQIRDSENDIGAVYGSEGNDLVIENNFLIYGKDASSLTSIASKILGVVSQASYRPFEGEFVGNPCIEVGDVITTTGKYEIVRSYVLNRTMTGVQALTDDYVSEGEEIRTEAVNGTNYEIIKLKGKTNELIRTADSTISRLTDAEKGISEVTQTASTLSSRITSVEGDVSTVTQTASTLDIQINGANGLSSRVTQTESDITAQAKEIKLKADKTEIEGLVKISDLSGGATTIDGACIKTGKVSAENIETDKLTVKAANIDGTIQATQVDADSIVSKGITSVTKLEVTNVTASDGNFSNGFAACGVSYNNASWQTITINGTKYTVLCNG